MAACLPGLDPAAYRPHALHDGQRNWPETNCYVDLWIEVLHALGLDVSAALGFTVRQDFEGDQFTFFKFPPEDLATLFDIHVQELAIYDVVERHTLEQLRRGRLVLIEADSFYLPDTRGTSYRTTHGKTTIAVNLLDPDAHRLHYFHNAGYFELSGADFDGLFREPQRQPAFLFPYVEFVKRGTAPPADLYDRALALMKNHLRQRPAQNPVHAYRQAFAAHARELAERPMEYFHLYSFNLLRQLGANFELLASHLVWLESHGERGLGSALTAAREIASQAKTMQFQLARAVARKKFEALEESLRGLAATYDLAIGELVARY
jgi:Domain of unknown function (DUF1839)